MEGWDGGRLGGYGEVHLPVLFSATFLFVGVPARAVRLASRSCAPMALRRADQDGAVWIWGGHGADAALCDLLCGGWAVGSSGVAAPSAGGRGPQGPHTQSNGSEFCGWPPRCRQERWGGPDARRGRDRAGGPVDNTLRRPALTPPSPLSTLLPLFSAPSPACGPDRPSPRVSPVAICVTLRLPRRALLHPP